MKPIALAEETPVITKTKELCATILDQPGYAQMKQSILDFLQHEEARALYEQLCDKQDTLQAKHQDGEPISEQEEEAFARMEKTFMAMPVADAFIKAQRQMHKIEKTVAQYVRKTFELGRVPSPDDFSGGGCGPSCGCSG